MRRTVEAQALRVVGRPRLMVAGSDAQRSVQLGAELRPALLVHRRVHVLGVRKVGREAARDMGRLQCLREALTRGAAHHLHPPRLRVGVGRRGACQGEDRAHRLLGHRVRTEGAGGVSAAHQLLRVAAQVGRGCQQVHGFGSPRRR